MPETVLQFDQVFLPRRVRVEGRLGSLNINYSLDTAARFFERPDFQEYIREYLKANPQGDVSTRNGAIAQELTEWIRRDLTERGSTYAEDPEHSPVPYLEPAQTEKNQAAINTVLENIAEQLASNVVTRANAETPPKEAGSGGWTP